MFSHCCINYGWNTDSVFTRYTCLAHTLHSYYLQYPTPLTSFCLDSRGTVSMGGGGGVGRGCASLSDKEDSYFDTHTVDSKQPWTNGNSRFFSHFVFYFLWNERNTQTVTLKKIKVFRIIFFWVMSLECQFV